MAGRGDQRSVRGGQTHIGVSVILLSHPRVYIINKPSGDSEAQPGLRTTNFTCTSLFPYLENGGVYVPTPQHSCEGGETVQGSV